MIPRHACAKFMSACSESDAVRDCTSFPASVTLDGCHVSSGTHRYMPTSYNGSPVPTAGKPIAYENGHFNVPDNPIIPFIEGDGTGRDIWRAASRVLNAGVEKAYSGKRRIVWYEVLAGEKAFRKLNTWLPDETVNACRDFRISI